MAKVIDVDLLLIETEDAMFGDDLHKKIKSLDSDQRQRLFAVVATGGTTNAGIIDDLAGIAEICESEKLWFHVDAAYGGGALAADSVRHLFNGIERADSITIDPHKWLFSPYDCGAVIYKNPELAKHAHAQEGSYLDIFKDEGANGFNPSDYQIQLTRRVRGMPLWFSLATHGTDKYKWAVERVLLWPIWQEPSLVKTRLLNWCVSPVFPVCFLGARAGHPRIIAIGLIKISGKALPWLRPPNGNKVTPLKPLRGFASLTPILQKRISLRF